ncbi:MAG: methyltransferase family protein [Anaerolineales bacterium]
MTTESGAEVRNQAELQQAVRKRVFQVLAMVLIYGAALFLAAGRLGWLWGWVYLDLYLALIVANALVMDRELVAERAEVREGTKGWDRLLGGVSLLLVQPVTFVVAGLDERFGWTDVVLPLQLLAALLLALANALVVWAMASNRFFAVTVRIQEERGHDVVTQGAYRLVRHPAYLAFLLMGIATPPLLDSWWAAIPALLGSAGMVVRTALEDRTLRRELPGYEEYAEEVRYRLLPGVW